MIRQLAVVLPSFALSIAFGQSAGLAEDGPTARAGWAESEITPPLGIALGGRGGPTTLANKILDPLYAQVPLQGLRLRARLRKKERDAYDCVS